MNPNVVKLVLLALIADLIAKGKVKFPKKDKKVLDSVLNKALTAKRLLPGAKIIRKGRPMTDFMSKIKKSQRRQLKGEYLKYRAKTVKGPQKALIVNNRSQLGRPYKNRK